MYNQVDVQWRNTDSSGLRTHFEQEASLVFIQKQPVPLLDGIGAVANVVCESTPRNEVHEQTQVCLGEDHRVRMHNVKMSFPDTGLKSDLVRNEGLQGCGNGPFDDFHCLFFPSVFALTQERFPRPTHA